MRKLSFVFFCGVFLCAGLACIFAAIVFLPREELMVLEQEGGLIEIIAASLAFAGAGAAFLVRGWHVYGLAMLLAGAREMDWHVAFTGYSLFKPKFFTLPEISVAYKLCAACVWGVLIYVAVMAMMQLRHLIAQRSWMRPVIVMACTGLFLLVAAKGLDSMYRIVPGFSGLKAQYQDYSAFAEEVLEVMGFVLLCAAPVVARLQRPAD
jgi:hypothetical protein